MSNRLLSVHKCLGAQFSTVFTRRQRQPRILQISPQHGNGNPCLAGFHTSLTRTRASSGLTRTRDKITASEKMNRIIDTGILQIGEYSTKAKVMTSSLHKWKKRKRKSKAQQKKELQDLHLDMIKMLSKRAIQLVQNKSLLEAHREVVTSHAFNHFRQRGDGDQEIYSAPTLDVDIHSFIGSKPATSDFIAQALEKEVFKDHEAQKEFLHEEIRKAGEEKIREMKLNVGTARKSSSASSFSEFDDIYKSKDLGVRKSSVRTDNHFSSSIDAFQSSFSQSVNQMHEWDQSHSHEHTHLESEALPNISDAFSGILQNDISLKTAELSAANTSEHMPGKEGIENTPLEGLKQGEKNIDNTSNLAEDSMPSSTEGTERLNLLINEVSKKKIKTENKHRKRIKNTKLYRLKRPSFSKDYQDMMDKAFVEVSCFTGYEKTALRNLMLEDCQYGPNSIDVYNRLMHAFAKKGDLKTIQSIFSMLKQKEIPPTLQTYAAVLECLARKTYPDRNMCQKVLTDVEKHDLDIADIAHTCSFEQDEMDYVLKAIRLVKPDFEPFVPSVITTYDNELLLDLNETSPEALEKNQYSLEMSKSEMMRRVRAQMELEKSGEVVVDSVYTAYLDSDMCSAKISRLREMQMKEWKDVLLKSFDRRLTSCNSTARDNMYMTLYPYLKLFPPEVYVDTIFKTLRELFKSSEVYSPTQTMLQMMMGQELNVKFNVEAKVAAGLDEKIMRLYEDYCESYLDPDFTLDNQRVMWNRAMNKYYDTVNMDMSMKKWPKVVLKQVGKFLLDMILHDLKIDANLLRTMGSQRMVPAFSTIYRPDPTLKMKHAEVKMHPVVANVFRVECIESFTFQPSIVPMVVPPVPWISKNMGGLLLGSNGLVRVSDDSSHIDTLKDVKEKQFYSVLDSLNTLSACAWKINKPILDLQIELFNNKGNASLKVAPPATECPAMPVVSQDMTGQEKAFVYRQRVQLQQLKQMMHGLWCSDLYRLSIANKFRDEIFWFPHSMDFRGRTYPLPPHFNHLGSDNVRGMLLFAKGKPLGEKGYDWLKIHLINLTGLKKRCSNQERLDFANSIMDDILDSADNPLTGKKWWQDSDEPWQTLSCCMEIAKIERFDGKTEDYVCHFPVHQDGSCNGLQHFAALGRDQSGAESVNLHPFDVPQDVYSDVVELVERERKKDAENGIDIAQDLEGYIKRKVIKQTVMTTVYGVTKYGAKLQIFKQLKDIPDFPPDKAWKGSLYLTDQTFNCLREMFTATKDIQDWLTEAAQMISLFQPVEWVTPLGFPVLQPYFKKANVKDIKQEKYKPNTLKQKNALPPNYIHSLDSTHMMLTSLYCMHAGITFVSVHDCYWTHACDVPIMNQICREQFVNMHQLPLLEDLSESLIAQVMRASKDPSLVEDFKKVDQEALLKLLKAVPQRGTFDLKNVLKSTYFFS